MRIRRIALWSLGITLSVLLASAAVIYALASYVPSAYPYRPLPRQRQEEAVDMLVNHILDFGNKAGAGKPFTWTMTAGQANDYLASLDAAAALFDAETYPSVEMEKAGFVGPAVAMREGILTFMIHAKRYDKIFSMDVAFDFDGNGDVAASTVGMRVGVMPVPQVFLAEVKNKFRRESAEQLAEAEELCQGEMGTVPVSRLARLLRNIVNMLDGQRVCPELVWPLGKHRVRVERLEITDGALTVHAVPARRR